MDANAHICVNNINLDHVAGAMSFSEGVKPLCPNRDLAPILVSTISFCPFCFCLQ